MRKIKYIASFCRMGIVPVRPFIFQTRVLFQQRACRFSKNVPTMDDLGKTSRVKRKRPEYGQNCEPMYSAPFQNDLLLNFTLFAAGFSLCAEKRLVIVCEQNTPIKNNHTVDGRTHRKRNIGFFSFCEVCDTITLYHRKIAQQKGCHDA